MKFFYRHNWKYKILDPVAPEWSTYRKCEKCGKVQKLTFLYKFFEFSYWKNTYLREFPFSKQEEMMITLKGKNLETIYKTILLHPIDFRYLDPKLQAEITRFENTEEGKQIKNRFEEAMEHNESVMNMEYLKKRYNITK